VMPDGVPMAWMAGLYSHRPVFVESGQGSRFVDVDGNSYIDFNLADLSSTIGFGETAVSRAVARQASQGLQFLLPHAGAIALADELAQRTGLPFWQFTLSASQANAELIRIARAFTGRSKVVLFEGKYHGHIEPTMAEGGDPGAGVAAAPEAMGISPAATSDTINIPFNDTSALERVLRAGYVALILTEPALTNCGLVLPDPGYLDSVYRMARKAGTLFALDEAHTWQFDYGGMRRAMKLDSDFLTLGKGFGTGVPLGAYGMKEELARFLEQHRDYSHETRRGLAIGGTTFGSPITMAGPLAALREIETPAAYAQMHVLGQRLADGIDRMIEELGLPWRAFRYGPRSGFCMTKALPRNYTEAQPSLIRAFADARRVYMANRGVWEAVASAGPQVSFAHAETDVDQYLSVARAFLAEVVSG
jgi:glutamate-1-semialdehyde aminotransferase